MRPQSTDPYIFFKSDRERRLALRHREICSVIKSVLYAVCVVCFVIVTRGPGGQLLRVMHMVLFE